ncbi:P-loop containing nucleoside triphosphate hydrolase protein [Massarina eburnea CBS 473.64]|uniref:RNA helicase n=1 Tax=Massarina eburnea CBS 473.64 TaxID=1395130 RepID=A0A6A6SD15_9PLEO|nr:P-loop containing nucleoside triphosphate hydrolase protein [Massarina eburnea CBS 473.64]
MVGKDCVAIACDLRLGMQALTVSNNFPKIFQYGDVFLGLTGLATDVSTVSDLFRYKVNMYRLREERNISPQTMANLVSSSLYEKRFGPYFVSPVIAGINQTTGKPFICGFDSIGCIDFAKDFIVSGTASDQLFGTCEGLWEPDLGPEDLFETVSQALLNAVDRDALSGWGAHVYIIEKDKPLTSIFNIAEYAQGAINPSDTQYTQGMDTVPPPPPMEGPPPPPPETAPPPPPPSDELGPMLAKPAREKKGWASQKKRQPPSIDDILKAKREKEAAAAKPKFLSKAERERIALEKRQKEVDEARKRKESASAPNGTQSNGTNGSTPSVQRGGAAAIPTGPRAMRAEAPTGPANMPQRGDMGPPIVPSKSDRDNKKRSAPEDTEAAMIRQRYMGAEQNQSTFSAKKKRRRTTEKKFNFEWNDEEDTSVDYNPIYAQKAQSNFFGRGKLGGFTEETAEQGAQKFIQAMIERDPAQGRQRAQAIMDMERRRKEKGSRTQQLDKHWSEKRLDDMRERDWRIFKEDFHISTMGGSIPNPMRTWEESGLPDSLLRIVNQIGYTEPSAIQRAAIPIALQSRDLIGVAETGSGKTASFVLPLLNYILQISAFGQTNRNDGPHAIILAPTRELAQQIDVETRKFANPLGFNTAVLVGGHAIQEQVHSLSGGAEIVIATPGRLLDCIERRVLVLNQCNYVILDEADKMISMGFEEDVNKILNALPSSNEKPDTDAAEDSVAMTRGMYRQTMLYTATLDTAIERVAKKYVRRPARVMIGEQGKAVDTVEQRAEFVPGEDKRKKRLQEILTSGEFAAPVMVFVNIKNNCEAVAKDIRRMGFNPVTLHGSKTQEQREAALKMLDDGRADVLVATDLAGRGIDVTDVSLVVNFNMPKSIDTYTHRIGRTGRAGKMGVAITFWGNEDADVLYDLKQMISKSSVSKIPEDLRKHEAAQQKGGRKKAEKNLVN